MKDAERAALEAAEKSLIAWSDARQGYIALCAPSAATLDRPAVKTLAAQGFLSPCEHGAYRISATGKRRLALSRARAANAGKLRRLHAMLAGI